MHCAAFVCAPDAENLTRQADARAAASASEIRVPAPSPSATLTGTVWPAFHFDPGTGEKNPRIRYSTTYCRLAVPVLPALSVAVHVTVWTPGLLVSIAPQPAVATPDVASVAFGEAVTPVWPIWTSVLLSDGLRVGAVRSTLNVTLAGGLSALPFASMLAA